jgi:hypothetical protein
MQVKEDYAGIRWGIHDLINSCGQDQRAVHRQRDTDEKPDCDHPASVHQKITGARKSPTRP